jgi:hypothetical protein
VIVRWIFDKSGSFMPLNSGKHREINRKRKAPGCIDCGGTGILRFGPVWNV